VVINWDGVGGNHGTERGKLRCPEMLRSLVRAKIRWYMTISDAPPHSLAPAHTSGAIS
jgi:hypothetical protein